MGLYRATEGKFDLLLSLRYWPPAGSGYDLSGWQQSFQYASDLLYHATDGQHALGRVYVVPKFLLGLFADVWLHDTVGDASADGRIWLSGTHAHFYADEQIYPFTILHELGHYLYGLRDEYKEEDGSDARCIGRRPATAEERTLAGDPFLGPRLPGACIMEGSQKDGDWFDGPFTRVGTVTDFCVECNHDKGPAGSDCDDGLAQTSHDDEAHDTRQSSTYQNTGLDPFAGTACWSVMNRHYPSLLLPVDRPDPDDSTPGPPTIEWTELLPLVRVVIGLDISIEFHNDAPWAWPPLRRALRRWIRMAPGRERWGGVAISREARTFGLVRLNPFFRSRAARFVNRLTFRPGTNLGKALKRAIDLIESDGDPACTQVIVLISGSRHSVGREPLDYLPALREHGIRVFGLAVGPGADVARISALADGTGGKWYRVRAPGLDR